MTRPPGAPSYTAALIAVVGSAALGLVPGLVLGLVLGLAAYLALTRQLG